MPEPGSYIVVWRRYDGPCTKPFKAPIVNASPTQVRGRDGAYTYNFIDGGAELP